MRLLMAAWDEIAAAGGVGVPLVVAGTGPLEREVTAWAAGRDDVRYVGLYDPAECREAVARAVANPTLVVHDRDDALVGIADVRAAAAALPAGTLVETHGLGHSRILHSSEVVGRVVEFVTRPRVP